MCYTEEDAVSLMQRIVCIRNSTMLLSTSVLEHHFTWFTRKFWILFSASKLYDSRKAGTIQNTSLHRSSQPEVWALWQQLRLSCENTDKDRWPSEMVTTQTCVVDISTTQIWVVHISEGQRRSSKILGKQAQYKTHCYIEVLNLRCEHYDSNPGWVVDTDKGRWPSEMLTTQTRVVDISTTQIWVVHICEGRRPM